MTKWNDEHVPLIHLAERKPTSAPSIRTCAFPAQAFSKFFIVHLIDHKPTTASSRGKHVAFPINYNFPAMRESRYFGQYFSVIY